MFTITRSGLLVIAVTAGGLSPAFAAKSEAEAAYQRERATCLEGRSQQDRATCLKEAVAARAEARKPSSAAATNTDAATLRENARQRCEAFAPAERTACLRMARGEGKVTGSVEGGGQLKELRTTVPAPASGPGPR
jgi:siroheme synthase (precorrin-2 oxidase/ferrochelatase)